MRLMMLMTPQDDGSVGSDAVPSAEAAKESIHSGAGV